MKKQPHRTPFTLLLTAEEKTVIENNSKAQGLSANAYIRFQIFQTQKSEISRVRSPLANAAIPEINVKIYSALCDIANSLREIVKFARDREVSLIKVDRSLLQETLTQLKKIGLQLASNKN